MLLNRLSLSPSPRLTAGRRGLHLRTLRGVIASWPSVTWARTRYHPPPSLPACPTCSASPSPVPSSSPFPYLLLKIWAAGGGDVGRLWHTTDGGKNWDEETTTLTEAAMLTAIAVAADDTIYGQSGGRLVHRMPPLQKLFLFPCSACHTTHQRRECSVPNSARCLNLRCTRCKGLSRI